MGMDAYKLFFECVGIFFILYMIGYASFLFLAVTVGSSTLYQIRRRNHFKNELLQDYYVPVTIVVPAYNEEITIPSTIRSLLSLDYTLYEIVIVDDGSTDGTARVLRDLFHMHPITRPIHRSIPCQQEESVFESREFKVPITLICKKNGGKADALNMGINAAKYPYFICMDADSVLQYDSLEKIVRYVMEEGNVVAVGGAVRPCNGAEIRDGRVISYHMPNRVLPCMQVLEYDRSFLAARILLTALTAASSSPVPSACLKRVWSLMRGGTIPPPWGRIWNWWSSFTCSAGSMGSHTASAMPPTPFAGPKHRKS